MEEQNPYEAPIADAEIVSPAAPPRIATQGTSGVGIFRKGNTLVMHKMAQLPDVCVKTGQPSDRRVKKKMQWHHPAIVLLVLVGLLVYLIVALIVMKKATIEIPVSNDWMRVRRKRLMITLAIFAVGGVLFGLGIYGAATESFSEDTLPMLFFAGAVLGFGGLIASAIAARIIWPAKIDDTHVHLSGVHSTVLSQFPEWPYG